MPGRSWPAPTGLADRSRAKTTCKVLKLERQRKILTLFSQEGNSGIFLGARHIRKYQLNVNLGINEN
jgi:hypothetical protein